MSKLRRKLLILAGILIAIAGNACYIYFEILPQATQHESTTVHDTVAVSVEQSVSGAIEQQDSSQGNLRLMSPDFVILSAVDAVPNGSVDVTEEGIDVNVGVVHLHAQPVIRDQRFELDGSKVQLLMGGTIVTPSGIESGIERGVNDSLARAGLIPISLQIEDESLYIEVSRA